MSDLDKKFIELDFFPHTDLFISWPNFIAESFSSERGKGHVSIKYSDIPVLVYVLASKVGTDFLPERILAEAKSKSFISFAHEECNELCENIKMALEFRRKLWGFLGDDKTKKQIFDEQLKYLKEKIPGSEYIGYVPESAEYSSVDFLYKNSDIYFAQRKDILRLNEGLSKEILKKTLEHYGILISPVLKPLLERL